MRDPATDLVVKELTALTVAYLSNPGLTNKLVLGDQIVRLGEARNRDPRWAQDINAARAASARTGHLVRKRGRPPRGRQGPIAGAVAMLVEEAGLKPTRSHLGKHRGSPSACSIVTAALKQLDAALDERTVEGIWDRCRQSSLIIHRIIRDSILRVVPIKSIY